MLKGHSSLDDLMQAKDKSSNHIPYKHNMKLKKPKTIPQTTGKQIYKFITNFFAPFFLTEVYYKYNLLQKKIKKEEEESPTEGLKHDNHLLFKAWFTVM